MSLNREGNTVVTYTGSHPILSSYGFNYGGPTNGAPHFGFDGSQGSTVIAQYWTEGEITALLPTLSVLGPLDIQVTPESLTSSNDDSGDDMGDTFLVTNPEPPGGPISYATFFADVSCGDQTEGQWNEVPFLTGTTPILALTNPTSCLERLSNVGFLLSITHIPLDDLNFAMEPPPGTPGSMFIDLTNLDGSDICPGCSISVTLPTPEPGSGLLLVTGCAGMLVVLGRRRQALRTRPARLLLLHSPNPVPAVGRPSTCSRV